MALAPNRVILSRRSRDSTLHETPAGIAAEDGRRISKYEDRVRAVFDHDRSRWTNTIREV